MSNFGEFLGKVWDGLGLGEGGDALFSVGAYLVWMEMRTGSVKDMVNTQSQRNQHEYTLGLDQSSPVTNRPPSDPPPPSSLAASLFPTVLFATSCTSGP